MYPRPQQADPSARSVLPINRIQPAAKFQSQQKQVQEHTRPQYQAMFWSEQRQSHPTHQKQFQLPVPRGQPIEGHFQLKQNLQHLNKERGIGSESERSNPSNSLNLEEDIRYLQEGIAIKK